MYKVKMKESKSYYSTFIMIYKERKKFSLTILVKDMAHDRQA